MIKHLRTSALVVATLTALVALSMLPAALTAETEPHPVETVSAKETEEPPALAAGESREPEKTAREKLSIKRLTIKKPPPEKPAPAPEPAPEQPVQKEPAPDVPAPEKPAPEKPARKPPPEKEPDQSSEEKRGTVKAGATRVPVLPGPARKASEKPPPEPVPPVKKQEPRDDRLRLSISRLGLKNIPVGAAREQAYLDREGIMHLSGSGFPHERDSNTYIAGHAADYDSSRIPNVFRNLHTMRQGDLITLRDSTGKTYKYRAYEYFVVDPKDVWITDPVPGKQVVSLQTCFPAPTFEKRLIVRGQLVS